MPHLSLRTSGNEAQEVSQGPGMCVGAYRGSDDKLREQRAVDFIEGGRVLCA